MKLQINILKILAVMLILLSTTRSGAAQSVANAKAVDGSLSATAPPETPDEAGSSLHKRDWRYTIHPSDTLDLTFMITPEFNQTLTVQPDGFITLRDVGDLKAAGKTLPELTEAIKVAYSKTLHDPIISIDLKDFEKPYFVVGGQVGKPGKFDWRGDVTMTQAIEIAGGFTDASKHSQVLLFRRVSDQWTEARIINIKKMMNSRNLQEDPELRPGDMLIVPKNAMSKIKPYLPTSYINPAAF